MPLDPQARAILDQFAAMNVPPLHQMPVAQARELMLGMVAFGGPPEAVARVEDRSVPGPAGDVPVRIYTPAGTPPFPVLVYFHGGGWVIGSVEVYDGPCRSLANRAGSIVVSVEYRLAPEHPFPAAPEDCHAATRWVAEHAPSLRGLPPAQVITAEFDPLCDDGEAYAARLREDGVPVRLSRYDGQIHGFLQMGAVVERGRAALDDAADGLAQVFAGR